MLECYLLEMVFTPTQKPSKEEWASLGPSWEAYPKGIFEHDGRSRRVGKAVDPSEIAENAGMVESVRPTSRAIIKARHKAEEKAIQSEQENRYLELLKSQSRSVNTYQ